MSTLAQYTNQLTSFVVSLPEEERMAAINSVKEALHDVSPAGTQPVDLVRWVPLSQVTPNDYNPNSVAKTEMRLLMRSILHDGYTQPVVTIQDDEGNYVIVDGFHRYFSMKSSEEIAGRTGGLLPVVVIKKDINDRMASTIRHNRARGKHSVDGMANMVFQMLDNGWEDVDICQELGMEAEELLRLKHITGFSKLFEDSEYSRAWVRRNQILARKKYAADGGTPRKGG